LIAWKAPLTPDLTRSGPPRLGPAAGADRLRLPRPGDIATIQ